MSNAKLLSQQQAIKTVSSRRRSTERPSQARAAALLEPRSRGRIIWNDDGDDLRVVAFGTGQIWSARGMLPIASSYASVEEFLAVRLAAIAETPVTVISYCGVFTWPVWDYPQERLAALGADPLGLVVDFAHRHGKDFYFNVRMNDAHTSGPHWQGEAYWEPFRLAHRDCLQARIDEDTWRRVYLPWARGESKAYPLQDVLDRNGPACRDLLSWATYDYSRREVRDYFLGHIERACERYDLEGIDLDWLRAPYYFRVGEERRSIPLLNSFVRRAAEIVRAAGKKRGRPIVMCMRVPDSPRRALELGLDVAHWIREGWVDLLVAGNGLAVFSMPFTPWQALCRPRQIPVIACISRSAPNLAEPEAFLGACQRSWNQGVDGLYFFNHFIPQEYETITRGSVPETLADVAKVYALDSQHSAFENGTAHDGPVPMVFEGGVGEACVVVDLEIPESVGEGKDAVLRVKWAASYDGRGSRWFLNGKPLSCQGPVGPALEYPVSSLKKGQNALRLALAADALPPGTRATLQAVSLRVGR